VYRRSLLATRRDTARSARYVALTAQLQRRIRDPTRQSNLEFAGNWARGHAEGLVMSAELRFVAQWRGLHARFTRMRFYEFTVEGRAMFARP
jgi:hypothetical protein